MTTRPNYPATLPPAVDRRSYAGAWKKNAGQRFQSAGELGVAMQSVLMKPAPA